ncbi:sulfolipid-1 biosynthesis phthioceranic/hydroxyphthioceranic acid synthase [Mycobacterium vicinigordonae]|uniref:Type I polyketide synthase n=1 Tax=Mycobacterium vicinigordonae TaxID=1719132 RepID=A0A7D6I1B9_9MYCO|nr:type I polyketide synthase [Mycobacterium vicinigordonae]QLL07794.1 type I polyketide synthase [Mycobacterium vicinigordonae]
MSEATVTPVALIGMGCRLPGGIDSPDKLWDALVRGEDLITEIPADHWDVDEFYDPEPGVPGKSVTRYGGFLDDIWGFDAPFFGLRTQEATFMDPNHRLLMETSWEAIEHAGVDPRSLFGSKTGVFMGIVHDDHVVLTYEAGLIHEAYAYPGNTASMASGRIAYWLGVHGPAMTLDTACSTGLLTLHLACRSLHEGESDLALAGGVNTLLSGIMNAAGSALGMYSRTGHCHSFDAAADGFVRSEGCAVVLLKRLPDAVRDGDRILAVVRGTAANHDGRTKTISRPSLDAQASAYRAALAAAGVDGATVGMVEAHGTGTRVGDPIEFGSLAQVYGLNGEPCALGSAKSNFGHTEAAAGTLGLIKATLALQHGVVPPSLHFTRFPDKLAEIETGLFVPTEATPWPTRPGQQRRRAAVSSYGLSGTNVHAVLEQAPDSAHRHRQSAGHGGPSLFALSATSPQELRRTAGRLAEWVRGCADQLVPSDLAYTLARRRGHRPVRAAVVAATAKELTERLLEVAETDLPHPAAVGQDDRGPVWVFSGQGSQWAAMGAELLAAEPVFAATVAAAEPLIAEESAFSVTEAMSAPTTVTGIDRVQPTLFTLQVALAAAMRSHGVVPAAVIGHSLGEVAAAVVAGALSLEDGVRVVCRRSRLLSTIAGSGAMASVELSAQRVDAELTTRNLSDVVVSVIASPDSTVIGGSATSVHDLIDMWERRDVMAREVAVDVASHSPQVEPILAELAEVLAELTPQPASIPFYSATLDDARGRPRLDGRYWVDNLRKPVRFADAVQAALEDGHRVFAELSPHPLLTRAVEQTAQAAGVEAQAIASLWRDQQLPHGLHEFLANLFCAGAAVDFATLYPAGQLVEAPLPSWTHRRHRVRPAGPNQQALGRRTVVVHPLLGEHVRLPEDPERHAWQGEVGTATLPWLGDHQVHAVPTLPGAAYCEMALAAACAVLGEKSEVRDIRFEQMLLLDEQTPLSAVASIDASGAVDFEVMTDHQGERTRRAVARLHVADDDPPPQLQDTAALFAAHPTRIDGAELRERFSARGVQLGLAFAGLIAAHTADDASTVLAEIALPGPIRAQRAAYRIHPALLDVCLQSVAAHPAVNHGGDDLLLPLSVRRLRICDPSSQPRYCLARLTRRDASGIEADLDVLDESGAPVLIMRGLRLGSSAVAESELERALNERLLSVEWQPAQSPVCADAHPGRWLLICPSDTEDLLSTRLAESLKALGAQSDKLAWPEYVEQRSRVAGELGSRVSAARGLVVVFPPPCDHPDAAGLTRAREHVAHLARIIRELTELPGEPPRLYVLTRAAQAVSATDRGNLDQAGLRGLLRVAGTEHPELRPTQIDVSEDCDPEKLALELLSGSAEDETAWRGDQWYVARLRRAPLRPNERRTALVDHACDGMRMVIRSPGDLATLEIVAAERIPPGPGQIEVAVTASSINFADVFVAFGQYPTVDGRAPGLGIDFAGVVTAVGPGVTAHRVGDHVGGLCKNGCWATYITCDERVAVTLPDGLTDQVAAATTSAHATAWYSLHDLAGIRAGERVLIHSATGGVGQAAIAIARAAGAQIFATAGSAVRRGLLRDMGIKYVYDSRSTEFAEQIRKDTNGGGVDIVLNSLTGAAQRAGLELLSCNGRFVEIGKRDVYGNTRLGLYPFRRNLTFHYVDMALLVDTDPERMGEVLRHVYRLVADGELPGPESTHYPLTEAATAIRVMSAAEHTGKLVLDIAHSGHGTVVVPPEQARVFRRDGAYVVTGGLGGLGLFLAGKMAAAGCGRIVLTSRSQPKPEVAQAIAKIRAETGAQVHVECGDIAEAATAVSVIAAATATGLPVRGVLHAAAVVEDATLSTMTDDLIERDWVAKVCGAWHLHQALGQAKSEQSLDWFCLFSSAAALLGSPGQGAYAAANSWLDAFTHWRRSQGLPATTIAWGAWAEIGRAASLEEGRTTMIAPEEGAYTFETLLRYDRAYTGYIHTAGTPIFDSLVARSPFAEAFEAAGGSQRHNTSAVRAELLALARDEWPARLRRLVSEQASVILRRSIDPDHAFPDHGLDSLGNLELRSRIEAETGIRITPKAIATHNTARMLARHLADVLAADQTPAPS